DDGLGNLPRLLRINFEDENSVRVYPIHDPPVMSPVPNPECPAPFPDNRKGFRLRHAQMDPLLEQPKEFTGLQATLSCEGRCLDFAMQPNHELVRGFWLFLCHCFIPGIFTATAILYRIRYDVNMNNRCACRRWCR